MKGHARTALPSAPSSALSSGEAAFLSEVRATRSVPAMPRLAWLTYLALLLAASSFAWSSIAGVREITHAPARVVPILKNQPISNAEGGILRELRVQEGVRVSAGQVLAQIDATPLEAQQQADQATRAALQARIVRLAAEAAGKTPQFAKSAAPTPPVALESANYTARRRALEDELAAMRRRIGRLAVTLRQAESLRDAGKRSDTEVAPLRTELETLRQQNQDRTSRFRSDAAAELAQAQDALRALDAQIDACTEALRRTTLRSPVTGLVMRVQPLKPGDMLAAGAPLMEVVPVSSQVLIEARIEADQIGALRVGQRAGFRLTGHELDATGELTGTIEYISPDAIDDDAAGAGRYYRAIVRAERPLGVGAGTAIGPAAVDSGAEFQVLPGMTGALAVHAEGHAAFRLLRLPIAKAREVIERF